MNATAIKTIATPVASTMNKSNTVTKTQKLKGSSRLIIALGALMMIGGYFFQLWRIDLEAPQYPEGLSMQIWVDKITGDVDKINGLNHYIGMKLIIQEEFIEFKVMPWLLASMIAFGLLVSLLNRRWFLWAYLIYMLTILTIGIYDFWAWEYDYGHNLNPHAAIIVPGMSYQPPLIGYKQLLNFLAGSLPDTGAYFVFAGGIAIAAILFYEQFMRKK